VHRGFCWGSLRDGVGGKIILKLILEMWVGGHGLNRSGSGQGHVAGCCECVSEPSGYAVTQIVGSV
jgi:hypothetical protein